TTLVTINANGTTYANIQPWKIQAGYADNNFLYTFIACHPTDNFSISPSNAATVGAPQFTFTMPLTGNSLTTPLSHENVPDALLAARFDHKRTDGKVKLSFYHILTGLRFRVNNYTDRNLTITGMTLSGRFYRSATFDFSSENVVQRTPSLASNNYQGVFTLAGNNGAVTTVPGNGSKLIGQTEANPDGTTILLLPNPDADPSTADANTLYSLGDNKDITIHYRYEGDNADKTSVIKDFHLSYTPAQSTRYTANLNFVGDKFVLIFMADNNEQWENGSDNNIDIN
ncbi:MAG: fimbrillin family protein, partial [Muribaculaceae bacterium]|nr:fimbrillin family protein [Muribaculaceae bacterium]